jgi:hypothetical protein
MGKVEQMSQRTLEDQAAAMVSGFNSTAEWALHQCIQRLLRLEARVASLDGQTVEDPVPPTPLDPED